MIPQGEVINLRDAHLITIAIRAEAERLDAEVACRILAEPVFHRLRHGIVEGCKVVGLACRDMIEGREFVGQLILETIGQTVAVGIERARRA